MIFDGADKLAVAFPQGIGSCPFSFVLPFFLSFPKGICFLQPVYRF